MQAAVNPCPTNIPVCVLLRAMFATRQWSTNCSLSTASHKSFISRRKLTSIVRSKRPSLFLQNNVVGATRLLQAALQYWRAADEPVRQAFRILNVSTDEVYGSLGADGKFSETTPYNPSSPYSASKAAADHFFRAFHHTYGLPTLITNCSNNFGPYQFPEKLIPLMILNALEGRPLPVYGDGLQVRDWLHVEDHVDALEVVLQQGVVGESYNIGGDCELPNLELVQMICDAIDRMRPKLPHVPCRQLIQHVQDRPGHDRRYAIDNSKLKRQLGWQPQSSIRTRLEETVQWYADHCALDC